MKVCGCCNEFKNDATLEDLELLVSYLKENGFE